MHLGDPTMHHWAPITCHGYPTTHLSDPTTHHPNPAGHAGRCQRGAISHHLLVPQLPITYGVAAPSPTASFPPPARLTGPRR